MTRITSGEKSISRYKWDSWPKSVWNPSATSIERIHSNNHFIPKKFHSEIQIITDPRDRTEIQIMWSFLLFLWIPSRHPRIVLLLIKVKTKNWIPIWLTPSSKVWYKGNIFEIKFLRKSKKNAKNIRFTNNI